jgi:predicted NAD/FAD-binding protein
MKIAIIGSGISGLGAAWLLHRQHDITVYEKNAYAGGHSRTIEPMQDVPVDTGFIVFNDWNYPNLFGLFRALGVPYEKSNMSFGVSVNNGWLEYSSDDLFGNLKNIKRFQYWGMLRDILKFNKEALSYLERDENVTLRQCLNELNMGEWFRNYYLLAMGAAIWSCPIETILNFPVKTYVRFFQNHGLLNISKRPQWYTVKGGSREYVRRLTAPFREKIKTDCGVRQVTHEEDRIKITDTQGHTEFYDQAILACHADEALAMIEQPTAEECATLRNFQYQENKVILHTDESFMPKRKQSWSSWVYLSEDRIDSKNAVSLTYWMNNLQPLPTAQNLFVTLNPGRRPKEETILDEHVFTHPVFTSNAVKAQEKIDQIQGKRGLWFCGAYQRYGFHEDGLLSAVNVAKKMGAEIPWE